MNHQLHFWFNKAKFALKPLRQTQDEIVVQWYWLRTATLKPRERIREDQDILAQAGPDALELGREPATSNMTYATPVELPDCYQQ